MSNLCGFFCLSFIYFLSTSKFRTKNIINDASIYLELFEDLDKINDVYKNEFVLSLFFTDTKSKTLPPRICHCLCVEVISAAGTRTRPKERRRACHRPCSYSSFLCGLWRRCWDRKREPCPLQGSACPYCLRKTTDVTNDEDDNGVTVNI
jgi:hypothetical protein